MVDYLYPDGRIAILAKAPIAGQVKTRMQPALSPEQSALLQERLIQHTVNTTTNSRVAPVQLWCSPNPSHPAFQAYEQRADVELLTQKGADLGERMKNAFRHNSGFTILVGTDCPLLTTDYFHQAASSILDSHVCITPAHDGGYVLIASGQQPKCFDNIEWGSDKVLQQSLSALRKAGQKTELLKLLSDLDHPEDLARLPLELAQSMNIEVLYYHVSLKSS